jgi:hypothetical protein
MAAWIARLALPLVGPLVRWALGRLGASDAGDSTMGQALARLLGLGRGITIPERARTHLQRGLAAWQDEAARTPEISDDLALVAARGLLGLLTRED